MASFADGNVNANGTVSHWAITDASALLMNGQLSAPQGVVALNTFALGAFPVIVMYQ
jgi:hypothetical protein